MASNLTANGAPCINYHRRCPNWPKVLTSTKQPGHRVMMIAALPRLLDLVIVSLLLLILPLSSSHLLTQATQPPQLQPQQPSLAKGNNMQAEMSSIETGRLISKILNDFFDRGYDKRVRPNYGGPPVNVNVTMRILSISSVSEVMMDFTADFYFRQTWVDPRLSFIKKNNVTTLYVGAEVSKRIWLPDTFFGNEKMAYFHEATTPNVFLRIDHTGEVYRSIRLTVTSSCPMKLQYFPMDRQQCTIEAESYGYNVKDIIYHWARATAVERDKTISLPQFDIIRTEQKTRIEELSSGTYSRLVAEIHFARRMGYYLIQIYIPSSLIVVISWVSFWLHRNASPARVQLGVTTVLTMTTLMSSTNAALPKISYVKSIDVFLGTCFVMVFAALLEYATVGYLGKRIAMRKAHAQNVLNHAVAMTQRMVAAQNQANLMAANNQNVNSATNHQMMPQNNGQQQFVNHHQQQANYAPNNFQKDQQHHNPNQQTNVVEQFINAAATLPNLVGPKFDSSNKRPINNNNNNISSTMPLLGNNPHLAGPRPIIDRKLGKLPKGKQLDSIFGVRPSSIDKYSRVVFPVCFVCFQLMYWIVYLHISAFLESDELENK